MRDGVFQALSLHVANNNSQMKNLHLEHLVFDGRFLRQSHLKHVPVVTSATSGARQTWGFPLQEFYGLAP
ncbi:hypothetical protein J6590_082546 [Homalodisca vitripennis]|nr:hypothetical protein J6590_082546 [Homalodisca vitripennis]